MTKSLNFIKTNASKGSGTSATSKTVGYGKDDPTILTWQITINNGGYAVDDSYFYDIVQNFQEYIPGSMTINYRNYLGNNDKGKIKTEKVDPQFIQLSDGTRAMKMHFGKLTAASEANLNAVTSIHITYQTKVYFSPDNNLYRNTAYSYEGDPDIDGTLISKSQSTPSWRGTAGGGQGDRILNLSGEKIWDDNDNQDGKRPASIQVNLYRNGTIYRRTEVQPNNITDNKWSYSFSNIPYSDANGNVYTYTVDEEVVPDGYKKTIENVAPSNTYEKDISGYKITNTSPADTIDIQAKKLWDDNNNINGLRPKNVQFQLYDSETSGKPVGPAVTLDETNNWTASWKNLPKNLKGKEIKYRVIETAIEGTPIRDYTNPLGYKAIVNKISESNWEITNKAANTQVSGKKVWEDHNNEDGTRPEKVTIELIANGNPALDADGQIITKEINASSNAIDQNTWSYEFESLPKFDADGKVIIYSVKEVDVPDGYNSIVDGYTITNYNPPVTEVDGQKIWIDDENRDVKRPESVKI